MISDLQYANENNARISFPTQNLEDIDKKIQRGEATKASWKTIGELQTSPHAIVNNLDEVRQLKESTSSIQTDVDMANNQVCCLNVLLFLLLYGLWNFQCVSCLFVSTEGNYWFHILFLRVSSMMARVFSCVLTNAKSIVLLLLPHCFIYCLSD